MDEDGPLVERAKSGDGEAFSLLIERHQSAMFGLAFRFLGDREDAMDAVQDSCVKAWRSIGEQRGGAFKSWMSSIVARTSLDRIRARRPLVPIEDEGRIIPLHDPSPGPESIAVARDRVASIEAALLTLSAEHRAVILLRDLNGLSYEEVGASLDIPPGTVRSRLARARVQLQVELLRRDPGILEAQA